MEHHKVLLLNASYEPLHICSWRRAVVLILKGKAVEIESHPDTASRHRYKLPLVIKLQYYVKLPYKSIPLTRKNLMHRDGYTCQYCKKTGIEMTVDHVLPRSRGGEDEWENVVVACHSCNVRKGSKTPEEAGMKLHCRPMCPVNSMNFEMSKHGHVTPLHVETWQKYMFGT